MPRAVLGQHRRHDGLEAVALGYRRPRALARVARRAALDERLPHVRQRVIVQFEEPVPTSNVYRRVGTRLLRVEAQRRRGRAQLRREALAYACMWPKGCRMTQEHRCDDELHRLLRQSVPAPSIDGDNAVPAIALCHYIFELAACKALGTVQHAAAFFRRITSTKSGSQQRDSPHSPLVTPGAAGDLSCPDTLRVCSLQPQTLSASISPTNEKDYAHMPLLLLKLPADVHTKLAAFVRANDAARFCFAGKEAYKAFGIQQWRACLYATHGGLRIGAEPNGLNAARRLATCGRGCLGFRALATDGGTFDGGDSRFWVDALFRPEPWRIYCSRQTRDPILCAATFLPQHEAEDVDSRDRHWMCELIIETWSLEQLQVEPFSSKDYALGSVFLRVCHGLGRGRRFVEPPERPGGHHQI